MSIEAVYEAIEKGTVKALKTATKEVVLSEEDLGSAFVKASSTGKKALIKHVYELGEVPQKSILLGVLELIKLGKLPLVQDYIDKVEDINGSDDSGRTALSYAAQGGKQKLVEVVLGKGATVNPIDHAGKSALHWALEASKGKVAKTLMEKGADAQGEAGLEMIEIAPSKPLKEALITSYLQSRVSLMSKEDFVAKWGEVQDQKLSVLSQCVDPLEQPIMKGTFYNVGYFRSDVDPSSLQLDWEAIDAARSLAEEIAGILKEAECGPFNTEGSNTFQPFFIPSLGRGPKTDDWDAKVSEEAKDAAVGNYDKFIRSHNPGSGLFEELEDYLNDDFINKTEYEAFKKVNDLASSKLNNTKAYYLYSDFVQFPVIRGGLDKYFNFVGVIGFKVWT